MNILLIYYTGTYNTRYLSSRLEELLRAHGHTVTQVEVRFDTPPFRVDGYDLVGIGYPIYGFNAPAPLERYLKFLFFPEGQRFFIYKNSGETFAMNNASSRRILRRLRRAGALFRGEYHFVMPYNIHFRFERDFVREILAKDEKLLAVMVRNLENGKVVEIKSKLRHRIGAYFVGIQKIGGPVNSFLYKVDPDKCTGCGKCARHCPQRNIVVVGNDVSFGHRCDMCMRCSFHCPQDAIHIGFLDKWRVNGDYHLDALRMEGPPETPYIAKTSTGFYSCFYEHFRAIDEAYEDAFGKGEEK